MKRAEAARVKRCAIDPIRAQLRRARPHSVAHWLNLIGPDGKTLGQAVPIRHTLDELGPCPWPRCPEVDRIMGACNRPDGHPGGHSGAAHPGEVPQWGAA